MWSNDLHEAYLKINAEKFSDFADKLEWYKDLLELKLNLFKKKLRTHVKIRKSMKSKNRKSPWRSLIFD